MDDLDYTPEQKLKDAVCLLRDEAYHWWINIKEATQLDHLTWDFFNQCVGASYVDVRRREFLNLTQGDRSVVEYEVEFLTLNRNA
ncbi:ATP-dependent zinc metalloprotease FtsH [Gossypium australe]|uniref:ATP-dependent zinc metalloprotease FtsH n=1 Tax=Gossypium australe TaxID=47621 RepID=A0A5B6WJ00_9ROSI|nr:ATP-dependent zinc metalloprotease FtsH [Gossypium australe]